MKNRLSEFQSVVATTSMAHSPMSTPAAGRRSREGRGSREADLEMGEISPPSGNPLDLFLSQVEQVRTKLERINKDIGEIELLHRQALTAVNLDEAQRLGRKIEDMMSRANAEAQFIRRTLKMINAENEELRANKTPSSSDLKIRTTQQARYAKKFMATMSRFQEMQITYQGKYKQQLERQYLIIKPTATREELNKLGSSAEGAALMSQQIFAMANKAQAQKTLQEMKERHQDILAIERSIKELHQMFVDMAIIVEQQSEMIDKVQDHVSNTLEYTEHAAIEMRGAVEKQRKIQKKKWILLLVCTILLVVAGLLIWWSLDSPTGGGKAKNRRAS